MKNTKVVWDSFQDKFYFKPTSKTTKFLGKSDVDVWWNYKHAITDRERVEALEELYIRHDKMFSTIARGMAAAFPYIGEFIDFWQTARESAIIAYDRYNHEIAKISNTKLSTYVYSTVSKSLLTMKDSEGYFKCPPQKRAMRSYLNGKYDNNLEKKQAFEQKNKLTSSESIAKAREKHRLLSTSVVSYNVEHDNDGDMIEDFYEQFLEDDKIISENDIINKMAIDIARESLSKKYQEIYDLYFKEQYEVKEICEIVGENYSRIRKYINDIKTHFKKQLQVA